MKYYYDGQLIRTSKTHHYAYACVRKNAEGNGWECLGCSATRKGAEKVKNEIITRYENAIDGYERAIKAINEGKKGYYNRRHEWIRLEDTYYKTDKAGILHGIEDARQKQQAIKDTWLIVEVSEEA